MKKELTLNELFELQTELNSILGEKLNILTKYRASNIRKQVDEYVNEAIKIRDEFITANGEKEEDGNIKLKMYSDEEQKIINPLYQQFVTEWQKLLETVKEIDYSPIPLKGIENIESTTDFKILFQFIEDPS